jgi:hypothetical protein
MSRRAGIGNEDSVARRSAASGEAKSASKAGRSEPIAPSELVDFDPTEVDPEELRDFMSADLIDIQADPTFKERLRSRLWKIVRMQSEPESSGEDE